MIKNYIKNFFTYIVYNKYNTKIKHYTKMENNTIFMDDKEFI